MERRTAFKQCRTRLFGWKAIAQCLGVSVRTAQRYALERGLPIRRVGPARGEVIFTTARALRAWDVRQTYEDDADVRGMTPTVCLHGSRGSARRLVGWKAIARYLQHDVRTVQRWERHYEMPVRRASDGQVWAFADAVDYWLMREPVE